MRPLAFSALALICSFLAACATKPQALSRLAMPGDPTDVRAITRTDGTVETALGAAAPLGMSNGGTELSIASGSATTGPKLYRLEFQGEDIRDITRQVLGGMLGVKYEIGPAVRGSSTIATAGPVTRLEALQMLDEMLRQNGATLIQRGDLYQVLPLAETAHALTAGSGVGGTEIIQLRYTRAADIAKLLQGYVTQGVEIWPDPDQNAVLIGGPGGTRTGLAELVRQLDIDLLQNASYELFPVTAGDPSELSAALGAALGATATGDAGARVRVLPMERIDAVLVIAQQPARIKQAREAFAVIEAARQSTARTWHVHYVQNNQSDVAEKLLKAAFQKSAAADTGASSPPQPDAPAPAAPTAAPAPAPQPADVAEAPAATDGPYAGDLPPASGSEPSKPDTQSQTPSATTTDPLRIISDQRLNAVMTYATATEEAEIDGVLAKIDLIPRQVRIDVVVAEVTTNDDLSYGTQFEHLGRVDELLTAAATSAILPAGAGFKLFHIGSNGAGYALSALAQQSTVRVLSSPQLTVIDDTAGSISVGTMVPYLSASAPEPTGVSLTVSDNVNYAQTGVVLQILPRIGKDGLVTLALDQELSDVDTTSTSDIGSPSFTTRTLQTKVSVEDGQTVALAGAASDTVSRSNGGIPILKDIPLLGAAVSNQRNSRSRTDILVFLTPHIIRDQNSARALTEDMRQSIGAARVPDQLKALPPEGSTNPNGALLSP